jgi:hypothetical protein
MFGAWLRVTCEEYCKRSPFKNRGVRPWRSRNAFHNKRLKPGLTKPTACGQVIKERCARSKSSRAISCSLLSDDQRVALWDFCVLEIDYSRSYTRRIAETAHDELTKIGLTPLLACQIGNLSDIATLCFFLPTRCERCRK